MWKPSMDIRRWEFKSLPPKGSRRGGQIRLKELLRDFFSSFRGESVTRYYFNNRPAKKEEIEKMDKGFKKMDEAFKKMDEAFEAMTQRDNEGGVRWKGYQWLRFVRIGEPRRLFIKPLTQSSTLILILARRNRSSMDWGLIGANAHSSIHPLRELRSGAKRHGNNGGKEKLWWCWFRQERTPAIGTTTVWRPAKFGL